MRRDQHGRGRAGRQDRPRGGRCGGRTVARLHDLTGRIRLSTMYETRHQFREGLKELRSPAPRTGRGMLSAGRMARFPAPAKRKVRRRSGRALTGARRNH